MAGHVVHTIAHRLESQTERSSNGCLLFTGHLTPTGYGVFKIGRKSHGAHRVAYREFVGPIPSGWEIDHLCSVRNCVEPTHLEVVTRSENLRRMRARRAALKSVSA